MHVSDDQNNKNQQAYIINGLSQHRIPTQHINITLSSLYYLIHATFNSTLIQHFRSHQVHSTISYMQHSIQY